MRSKGRWILIAVICLIVLIFDVSYGCTEEVPVLVYHDVVSSAAPEPGRSDQIPLNKFKEQMKYLYDNGYTVISIDELVGFMKGKSVSRKSIVLTFDDGWKSTTNMIPILKRYHFKASFFIFPGKGIAQPSYMDWDDILAIAKDADFQIESHTMTHPWDRSSNLVTWIDGKTAGKGARDVEYELRESKSILEKKLSKRVRYLAWPMGWYNEKLIEMAKDAGYEALLTAEDGVNTAGGDVFRIKRILIDGACDMAAFEQGLQDFKCHVCQRKRKPTLGDLPNH